MSNFIHPLPSLHRIDMSSSSATTEQPHFHLVPIQVSDDEVEMRPEEEHVEPTQEEEGELPTWAKAMARISPRSALTALATHPHNTSAHREVINGLVNNIRYQQGQSDTAIRNLQVAVEGQQVLIDDLMQ